MKLLGTEDDHAALWRDDSCRVAARGGRGAGTGGDQCIERGGVAEYDKG